MSVDVASATVRAGPESGSRLFARPPRRSPAQAVSVVLGLGAVAAGARYLHWRLGTLRGTGAFGAAFFGAEVVTWATLAWTVALIARRRRRQRIVGPPSGTLDVFVTVCGEPPEMVERTLRAAIAIDYPHTTYVLNDGRIAGRDDWAEIDGLAAAMGVGCFTRVSGGRGKASNLNHALARTHADAIVTLDADHEAEPDLGHRLLGYLADPAVGFVASAQRFDTGVTDVLNNAEAMFYRVIQPAKDVDSCAFSCGNGSLYRRSALAGIGGFSDWNLVEDLHTSYQLHAAGWTSVYEPTPVSTGTAPATAAVYANQRMRWAMDSIRLLLFDNPLTKRGLSARQRLHYLHTTASYLLIVANLMFLVTPVASIVWRTRVTSGVTSREYVEALAPYLGLGFAFVAARTGVGGAMRTVQSAMFNAPLSLLAFLRVVTGGQPRGGATQKTRQPRLSRLLVPQVLIAAALAGAIALYALDRAGRSVTAMCWAGLLLFLLIGPLLAVSERVRAVERVQAVARLAVVAVIALVVVASAPGRGGLLGPSPEAVAALVRPAEVAPDASVVRSSPDQAVAVPAAAQALAAPAAGTYLGASADVPKDAPETARVWRRDGVGLTTVAWFQQWRSGDPRFRRDLMDRVAAAGAVPMVTWEPWASPAGLHSDPNQPGASLSDLLSGRYDAYIRGWARAAADYRRPILLRFMHEPNGIWYPWSVLTNGNTPAAYVAAWRHVHDIFAAEGATNVSWVWSLVTTVGLGPGSPSPASYYPGDAYVDWVGATVLNWGDTHQPDSPAQHWTSFTSLFADAYPVLAHFRKPVMISEMATTGVGGDQSAWLRDAAAALRDRFPLVRAVVLLDQRHSAQADFRLTRSTRDAVAAIAREAWSARPRIVPAARAPAATATVPPATAPAAPVAAR